MKKYYVEGLFLNKKAQIKATWHGAVDPADIEPFARAFWAASPSEAEKLATEALTGGRWVEGPHIDATSEEQRMRAMGAPELPGFGSPSRKRVKKVRR